MADRSAVAPAGGCVSAAGRATLAGFAVRAAIIHTTTYLLFGLLLSWAFDYRQVFALESIRDFMRPFDSPFVAAGPLLQPIRGVVLAIAAWPLRGFLVAHRRGWLVLWGVFLGFGILGPPAAAPCSMEGVIYSKLPLSFHLMGLPEICLQTLAFSAALWHWERRIDGAVRPVSDRASRGVESFVRALVAACFAWIGYAIGGLLIVRLAGLHVDVGRASASPRTMGMFVVAFLANLLAVLAYRRWWQERRPSLVSVFVAFWLLDTAVPWLYQALFTHPSRPHLALLLGLFPAVVLTGCVRAGASTHPEGDAS